MPPPPLRTPLPIVYMVWAFAVLALSPLCRWLAGLKQRSRPASAPLFLTQEACKKRITVTQDASAAVRI
jgi:hypothetical protein